MDIGKKFRGSELRNGEMARTVIELGDFVNLVNSPTSTLNLKMLMLYIFIFSFSRSLEYELRIRMVTR